jgi:DNA-binding NarL/FixJ family response regulator
MIERRRARKRSAAAMRVMSSDASEHAIVRAPAGERENVHSSAVDDRALLAVLVPIHTARYGDPPAPTQLDWSQSSYALLDADSPSADRLRQIIAIQQQEEPLAGQELESVEELLASAGIERLMRRLVDSSEGERVVEPLSRREQDVLRLIVAGQSNHEIAQALTVAVSTVKMHVKHIYSKLGVSNRMQAIAHAWSLQTAG